MAHTETGIKDAQYDLISVLYHTLQEAETLQQYIDDAKKSGDEDMARFYAEVQEQDRARAQRAKELLGRQLSTQA